MRKLLCKIAKLTLQLEVSFGSQPIHLHVVEHLSTICPVPFYFTIRELTMRKAKLCGPVEVELKLGFKDRHENEY